MVKAKKSLRPRSCGHLTEEGKKYMLECIVKGLSLDETVRLTGCAKRTVLKYTARWQANGNLDSPPRKKKKRMPGNCTRFRRLRGFLLSQEDPTSRSLARDLAEKGDAISPRQVRRILREYIGARYVPKVRAQMLTPEHKAKRIKFAQDRALWDTSKVWFSDEAYFKVGLRPKNHWNLRGRRKKFRREVPHPIQVMVWGAISREARAPLQFSTGNMNWESYKKVLLKWKKDIGGVKVTRVMSLMQDGAPAHKPALKPEFAQSSKIQIVPDWPPNSCDLNPIENIWGYMAGKLQRKKFKTLEDLKAALKEVWDAIPQEMIRNAIDDVPKRLRTVIAEKGEKVTKEAKKNIE